jgi:glucosamine-6-phosphate deaminase
MKVRTFDEAAQASRAVARLIARHLTWQPASVLGLPTGRTSVSVYKELVRLRPDFSRAHTFNLDEFVGLPAQNRRSFHAFMDRHLFCRVNLPRGRGHFLDGDARDLDAECARFERAIAAAGGIDLLVLGIGANGHIGFNEPGAALLARTHRARLTAATRRANAGLFAGRPAMVPREALSMGMGTILAARAIVLVATGRSKARAINAMLSGRITPSLPASFLQLHDDVQLVLDQAAAGRLRTAGSLVSR